MKFQRLQKIEDYLSKNGFATTRELCDLFNVSQNTVRRDIDELSSHGNIHKIYGGVMYSESLVDFENRYTTNKEHKLLIAHKAAELIENNDLIFIDSGTTTQLIIQFLHPEKHITIITNNLDVVTAIADHPNIELILVGNRLKRKTHSFIEVDDWSYFNRININKAFMAATGVSLTKGTTNSDMMEYEIKNKMMRKAEHAILLVDSSLHFNTVITDQNCPSEYKNYFKKKQVNVFYV